MPLTVLLPAVASVVHGHLKPTYIAGQEESGCVYMQLIVKFTAHLVTPVQSLSLYV